MTKFYDELLVDVHLPEPFNETIRDVDASLLTDPDENMLRTLDAVDAGHGGAMFDMIRLLGIDSTGWRASKVAAFMEAFMEAQKEATELTMGESSGSEKSSEPTRKKSSSR